MKNTLNLIVALLMGLVTWSCQTKEDSKFKEVTHHLYDSSLKPFYHGVASGDPLHDRVILWTRVTPEDSTQKIVVTWQVSETANFSSVVKSGETSTSALRDFTVKVDAEGLTAGKIYFYRFQALGKTSPVGRTKTLPEKVDSVKFAIVSCANWEFGYFNPYDKIADRSDVDAVVHLGDYLYEYKSGGYGDTTIGRFHLPAHEIVSLWDYRTRHAQYRLDQGLMHVSQQHPMIAIWDDHEIANDSYTEGAQNHQPEEGDYTARKNAAKQAYYEWLPIREGEKHYRSFSYGDLVALIMLDERLEGRTKPVDSLSDPIFNEPNRAILGASQLTWFQSQLKETKATWKVVGNQAMFSDVLQPPSFRRTPRNFDSWDGYPAEKKKVIDFIQANKLSDILLVTGDTHASWAIEVPSSSYNPKTSAGAVAIELGTTSISSGNDDERKSVEEVRQLEEDLLKLNPHIKYVNDRDHGYLLLTLTRDQAKAEWYYVETLRTRVTAERLGNQVVVKVGNAKFE